MKVVRRFLKLLSWLLIAYGILFILARMFLNIIFPHFGIQIHMLTTADAFRILPIFLPSILAVFTALIYLFNSWLEGKWLRLKWPAVLFYMGITAGLGPTAEILGNLFARIFLGHPFWLYQLLPVHGGGYIARYERAVATIRLPRVLFPHGA